MTIDDDQTPGELQSGDYGEIPLCPRCLSPVDPLKYYCDKCGEATGQFTPYIPFVNIRFNYSIFGVMWRKVWFDNDTSFISKTAYLLLIVLLAPVMLIGLPFVLWEKIRRKSDDD